jgi:hypothetical protein
MLQQSASTTPKRFANLQVQSSERSQPAVLHGLQDIHLQAARTAVQAATTAAHNMRTKNSAQAPFKVPRCNKSLM